MSDTPKTDELKEDIWATHYVEGQDFANMVNHAKKLERERDRLRKALNVLIYWRYVSECVCSDPLPNGACLRCDLDKILNETKP